MKRVIRLFTVMMLVLSLVFLGACGDDDKADKKEEKKVSQKTEQSAEEKQEKSESGPKTKKKKKRSDLKAADGGEKAGEDENGSRKDMMMKNRTDESSDSSDNKPGASFEGDWEGMTIFTDSEGMTSDKEKLKIFDDYIIGTFARIRFDDDGNIMMDMVGITPKIQLNYSIDSAVYDAGSDTVRVAGKTGGGTFDTIIEAPGKDGVLTFSGRTNGDIKSNYTVYMKRLGDKWERSDAPKIADKEYNVYIINNLPLEEGMTLEERVAKYSEAGVEIDMSDFLKP